MTGIVAPPAGPDGRADHIHGLGLGLNKKAKNKEGAVKFLTWLSSEEAALLYAKSGGSPALTPDVVAKLAKERPDLVTLGDFASRYGYVMTGGDLGQCTAGLRASGEGVHRLLVRTGEP